MRSYICLLIDEDRKLCRVNLIRAEHDLAARQLARDLLHQHAASDFQLWSEGKQLRGDDDDQLRKE